MTASETYGDFTSIVGDDPAWVIGSFALPDGSTWEFREPDAVAVVQNGRLRVSVRKLTRHHDHIQILDNAKHMFYSARPFAVPTRGAIAFELTMRSQCLGTTPGDLYDGFVSFHLLDFSTGVALDWFLGQDRIAPVHARLPFPGVPSVDARPLKYFAVFDELPHTPGAERTVRISYDPATENAVWSLDGVEVMSARVPVKLSGFIIALGVMTEKDLTPSGSVSCHGQSITGDWSPITVRTDVSEG